MKETPTMPDTPDPGFCHRSGPTGYLCTIEAGHDGDHVARGAGADPVAAWPRTDDERLADDLAEAAAALELDPAELDLAHLITEHLAACRELHKLRRKVAELENELRLALDRGDDLEADVAELEHRLEIPGQMALDTEATG